MTNGAILVCCSILVGTAACRGDAVHISPQVVVTDSAGHLHVGLGPLPDITTPRWEAEELHRSRVDLFRVTAARFLPDGSLAVANSGTQEILRLGPDGSLKARIGGSGEGPGEFRHISTLILDREGNVVAYDPRLGRMTVFGPDGGLLETRRFAAPSRVVDLLPLALLGGRRTLAIIGSTRIFAEDGIRRDSTPLVVYDSTGEGVDTLGVWGTQEWSYVSFPQGSTRTEVGFGRTLAYAGRKGYSVLGSTDSIDLTVFDGEGRSIMRLAGGGPGPRVGAAEIERWRAELLEARSDAPEFLRRAIAEAPYRETYPAFGALVLDDARRLWIGAYGRPGDTDRQWIVIGPDGELQGTIALPADAQLLDSAGDRLAVLRRNELDEEQIAVLGILQSR